MRYLDFESPDIGQPVENTIDSAQHRHSLSGFNSLTFLVVAFLRKSSPGLRGCGRTPTACHSEDPKATRNLVSHVFAERDSPLRLE